MTTTQVDRPAAIRKAMRDLVAEHGFHGSSMSAVARAAGVATGTAYVHYDSKEELVYATYLEVKSDLAEAVMSHLDTDAEPAARYRQMWRATYSHLAADPARARFLTQLEESPFYAEAHRRLIVAGDPLLEEAARPDVAGQLVSLPPELLYALSLGLAVRLVASGLEVGDDQLETLVEASWRAVTV